MVASLSLVAVIMAVVAPSVVAGIASPVLACPVKHRPSKTALKSTVYYRLSGSAERGLNVFDSTSILAPARRHIYLYSLVADVQATEAANDSKSIPCSSRAASSLSSQSNGHTAPVMTRESPFSVLICHQETASDIPN